LGPHVYTQHTTEFKTRVLERFTDVREQAMSDDDDDGGDTADAAMETAADDPYSAIA
jgi:hypothetical protein